jgi:MFS family permease
MKKSNKHVIINFSLVIFFIMTGFSMTIPILPIFARELGASNLIIGLAISAYGLARAPLNIPFGILLEKKNPFNSAILGLVFILSSSIILFFSQNLIHFVIAKIIEGIGFLIYILMALRILAEYTEKKERGGTMGIYTTGLLVGTTIGPLPGGYISEHFGLRYVFLAYFFLVLFSLIIIIITKKNIRYNLSTTNIKISNFIKVIKNKNILIVSFSISSIFILRTSLISVILPILIYEKFKLSESYIGLIISTLGIATIITTWPSGKLSDKIGRKVNLLTCLLFSSIFVTLIPLVNDFFYLQLLIFLLGLILGFSGPFAAYIADLSTKETLTVALSVYRTFVDLGFFIGPFVGGIILEFFEVTFVSFLLISLFTFISFILALTIKLEPQ